MRGEGVHAVPLPDLRPQELTGADGIMRAITNHAGLIQAFEWCAHGSSARDIAMKLNTLGYRTTGAWGSNPFSKDTIQRLLSNRFYLGQLPDGQGGWIDGQHAPLISAELWDQAQRARLRHRKNPQTIPGHARVHVLGGGLLRCGICALQGRSSALHVSKSRKDEDSAYYACYGRFQGQPCTQSAVADHVLEVQLTGFFDAFVLPDDFQTRILDLYQREHQTANTGENNPAARRAQLEGRLERQRHLYELGDWTRERFLAARNEILSELAELDMSHPTNPTEDPEAITRLGAYVRELRTAWRDADKAQRRLLVRTLFEQIWVVGDRLFAAKPVPQFAPFFRLVRNLQGDDMEQRVYLAPTFSLQDDEADAVEEVGEMSKKMAQDLDGIEDTGRLSRQLQKYRQADPTGLIHYASGRGDK